MSMLSAGYTRTLMRAVWTGVNTRRPMVRNICEGRDDMLSARRTRPMKIARLRAKICVLTHALRQQRQQCSHLALYQAQLIRKPAWTGQSSESAW